jgi:hypothetical protein
VAAGVSGAFVTSRTAGVNATARFVTAAIAAAPSRVCSSPTQPASGPNAIIPTGMNTNDTRMSYERTRE